MVKHKLDEQSCFDFNQSTAKWQTKYDILFIKAVIAPWTLTDIWASQYMSDKKCSYFLLIKDTLH